MVRRIVIPYKPGLKKLARNLRIKSTKAEIKLWIELKGKRIQGFDFHRQKPIDQFIIDFFCHELMLGIEVDGISHQFEEVQRKDATKEERMSALGIHLLRFQDEDVMRDMANVLRVIHDFADRKRG